MIVKNNIRVLMARNEYNIKDVHEKTGLSRTTISKLFNQESNTISFDTISKLCILFDCEVADLLYLVKEDERENPLTPSSLDTQ